MSDALTFYVLYLNRSPIPIKIKQQVPFEQFKDQIIEALNQSTSEVNKFILKACRGRNLQITRQTFESYKGKWKSARWRWVRVIQQFIALIDGNQEMSLQSQQQGGIVVYPLDGSQVDEDGISIPKQVVSDRLIQGSMNVQTALSPFQPQPLQIEVYDIDINSYLNQKLQIDVHVHVQNSNYQCSNEEPQAAQIKMFDEFISQQYPSGAVQSEIQSKHRDPFVPLPSRPGPTINKQELSPMDILWMRQMRRRQMFQIP